MRIDREKQEDLRVRALIQRKHLPKWNSLGVGTYDPEDKLKKAWITTHLARQERNKKRKLELGEEPIVKPLTGVHDA